jgi:hypothetical protein
MSKKLPAYSYGHPERRKKGYPAWNLSECVAAARTNYGDEVARKIEAAPEAFDVALVQEDDSEVEQRVIHSHVAERIVVAHFAGARLPNESNEEYERRGWAMAQEEYKRATQ